MSANRPKFFRTCLCCEPTSCPDAPADTAGETFWPAARRRWAWVRCAGLVALRWAWRRCARPRYRCVRATSSPMAKTRIDVHHHFIPPFHVDAMMAPGRRTGAPPPKWSPALSLEDMDKSGIATSILSIAQPGVWYGNNVEESRKLGPPAQRIRRQHRQATIPAASACSPASPPPDVRREPQGDRIRLRRAQGRRHRASDELSGQVSGRSRLRAGLRGAQPPQGRGLCPPDHARLLPRPGTGIPPGSIEYATDSTRTIAHLVFSGTAAKFPDIRWIFSHCGGTLPFLTGRFIRLAEERKPAHLPNGPLPEFKKFHYGWRRATRRARSPRC